MLKQRVITALILAIVLIWAVFGWSTAWFSALLALVSFISSWEWSRLCGLRSSLHRGGYALVIGSASMLLIFSPIGELPVSLLSGVGFLFWSAVTVYLLRDRVPEPLNGRVDFPRMVVALPVFALAIWGLMWLRESELGSPLLFVYVFCIVWLADIGAYFAGRRWGKRKLAPNISPGKTLEGVAGGVVAVCVWAAVFVLLSPFSFSGISLFISSLVAGAFSVFGDLFESAMKRSAGVKDSGAILPGHGGMLDRIDSVLAAVPVFIFCSVALTST